MNTTPLSGARTLGQSSLFNSDPFAGAVPSPASHAAGAGPGWQPTEAAKHLPELNDRLVAGGAAAALVFALLLISGA